jgi:hypothetical protein
MWNSFQMLAASSEDGVAGEVTEKAIGHFQHGREPPQVQDAQWDIACIKDWESGIVSRGEIENFVSGFCTIVCVREASMCYVPLQPNDWVVGS